MAASNLRKLEKILQGKISEGRINYVVPDLWNAWDYDGSERRVLASGNILVNPYRFYSSVISHAILPQEEPGKNYHQALSKASPAFRHESGGDWIRKAVLYSMMVRTSTTWDHDRSESIDLDNLDHMSETGTFVKTLALLPLLKKMGVDTLYLLPVSRFSRKNKKGELGSPYGIASFVELDPDLKDPLSGDAMTVEEEFSALVEACHILKIRVVIDIIPRTNSIDSDLVSTHPDWFYWIEADQLASYKVPSVPDLPSTVSPEAKHLEQVYASDDVKRHIQMFRNNPKDTDPFAWQALISNHPDDLHLAIQHTFNRHVAPAFSDHINDTQPPWTDITFFRLYLDHPSISLPFLEDKDNPPYILFDTIKANRFPGCIPNQPLWDHLAQIIPSYQSRFGIDGARIDMGHALPEALLESIITSARANNPDFAFIAEELSPDRASYAKKLGYNIIIGNGFWMEPRIWEKKLHHFVYDALNLALPMFAAAETHDSPRIAARDGGKILARMLTVFNLFLPNLVPFLNSGQEVYELQPMNTGVDTSANDRFVLPESDPQYGKLALFDKYAFHYLAPDRWEIADHLDGVIQIRQRWVNEITDGNCAELLYPSDFDSPVVGVGYTSKRTGKCLVVLANSNPYASVQTTVNCSLLREKADNHSLEGKVLYATYAFGGPFQDFTPEGDIKITLNQGEVILIEF